MLSISRDLQEGTFYAYLNWTYCQVYSVCLEKMYLTALGWKSTPLRFSLTYLWMLDINFRFLPISLFYNYWINYKYFEKIVDFDLIISMFFKFRDLLIWLLSVIFWCILFYVAWWYYFLQELSFFVFWNTRIETKGSLHIPPDHQNIEWFCSTGHLHIRWGHLPIIGLHKLARTNINSSM